MMRSACRIRATAGGSDKSSRCEWCWTSPGHQRL